MKRHVESVHEGKKPFKCELCDYTCAEKGNLKVHVESFMRERSNSNVKYVTTAVLKKVT